MNPLMTPGSIESYYEPDEYDFAPLDPGSEATEGELQLTAEGIAHLASDMTELFRDIYNPDLIDPVRYIHSSIKRMLNESSASDEVKERVNGKTWIAVDSVLGLPFSESAAEYADNLSEQRHHFRLEEIVTDTYRRKTTSAWNTVVWPKDFPADLVKTFKNANLQASYQADVETHLDNPKARFLSKLRMRIEVEARLRAYASDDATPTLYRQLIQGYFDGAVLLESVQFTDRFRQYAVPQVAYLRYPAATQISADGLLIFLGEPAENAILRLPYAGRRKFIETSPELHRLMFERLPLKAKLTAGNDKFFFINTYFGNQVRQKSPFQFFQHDDIFKSLHDINIARLKADIDLLVSTDGERLNDLMFKVGIVVSEAVALAAAAPAGPSLVLTRALVTVLAGGGAVAFKVLRGVNEDFPDEAKAFYQDALKDLLKVMVGRIAEFAIGAEHTSEVISQVSDIVYEELIE